ncbi:MAG: histidine phosphatase family protein [Chloroflexota bacterium]
MLTVLLTRHGHTDRSEPEQYLGQRLPGALDARGRKDARALARRLATVPIERAITSPLSRAVDTAQLIVRGRGIKVEPDDRLTELDYGAWEGHTLDQINRLFPGEYEQYDRDPATHHVGGGESGYEVVARLAPLFDELVGWAEQTAVDGSERTVLVVGHSSVNRIVLAMLLGVELNDYRRRFDQDWANLTVLRWPDRASGPRLLLSNDQSHARGIKGETWG